MRLTPTEVTLSPTHHVAFPGVQFITAVDFSPDGRTAYVVVDGDAVDLWKVGLKRWPELLGGALVLVLLVYLLCVLHVRRRSQVKGEPHCRKCNYNLKAHAPQSVAKHKPERVRPAPGTVCPECGVDISRRLPRRGRSTPARLWLPTALLLLCLSAYAWLWISGVPRNANAPDAPEFWLPIIDRLAEKTRAPWLLKHRVNVYRLMLVDTATGQTRGCLRTMRFCHSSSLRASPDGRFLVVADSTTGVSLLSTRTGWRVASTQSSLRSSGMDEGVIVAVEGTTDLCVYIRCIEPTANLSRLVAWYPRSGREQVLVEEPAYVRTYPNGRSVSSARRYALVGRPDQLLIASAPDFTQAYHEKKYSVSVWGPTDAAGGPYALQREIKVPGGQDPCMSPLVSTFGSTHLFVQAFPGVHGFDATTGESLGTLTAGPHDHFTPGKFVASPQGDRLFLESHQNSIFVRDIRRMTWAARLKFPPPFIGPHLHASTDGRWLAATPFKSLPTPAAAGPYIHELFLYDLTQLKNAPSPD
jgi:hypothetical protein